MRRLVVTGANGSGKSHVASRLHLVRPDAPLVSYDALRLERDWQCRSRTEIDRALASVLAKDAWILEGGPSLLERALPRADAVIWLDPPEWIRAWRLLIRPWRNLGKTRPELPPGNREWPIRQSRFALQSLRKRSAFRASILQGLKHHGTTRVWHCRTGDDVEAAVLWWRDAGS